jgi:hypothetical protein
MALVMIILLSAFGYVWLNPEGGDSWDANYFFTHPAFFIIFTFGFIAGYILNVVRTNKTQSDRYRADK